MITLPDASDGKPINWPGMSSNKLFVRPIFRDFFDKAEHLNEFHLDSQRCDWLMRGIPGIGKSSFGLYCLWRLVTAGRRVRYWYPRGCSDVMEFGNGGLLDAYIVDGVAPPTVMGVPTLLISSPRGGTSLVDGGSKPPIYDDFLKHPLVQQRFMPAPDTAQLLLLGETCFPTVPRQEILGCIQRWGPVFRPIFAVERTAELKSLQEAVSLQQATSLALLARSMSEKVVIRDISFQIVHYDIDVATYSGIIGFKWASEYIEQRVFEVLMKQDMRDRLQMLQDMLSNKSSLSMCQALFEDWSNVVMQRGSGSAAFSAGFRVRRLGIGKRASEDTGKSASDDTLLQAADRVLGLSLPDEKGIYRLKVLPASTLSLQKPDELRPLAAGNRWRAKACFAAADFIEASGFCSNATVSDNHTLGSAYRNGLRAILEHLKPSALAVGSNDAVPFVWLVPASVFPHFTVGLQVVEGGGKDASISDSSQVSDDKRKLQAARKTARQLGRRVVQYALEIPNPVDYETG